MKSIKEKLVIQRTQLLLLYVPPHKPVGSATIARYVKLFLNLAGIDVTVDTAYSTRSSKSSRVKNLGLSLTDIQKAAGWSQGSTFRKLYKLPLKNSYGTTFLQEHTVTV